MTSISLIRPPRLRRAETEASERRATWLELFFDLVFAAAVAEVGSVLSEHYTLAGLATFTFLFFLIWWSWVGHTLFSTRFDNDDLLQRLLTLGQVFMVAVMAVNARGGVASRDAAGFAAAYAGLRATLGLQYLRVVRVPESRRLARGYAVGILGGALLWLASALAPVPVRFGLWAMALAVDLATPVIAGRSGHRLPLDPAHLPERFGLFTLILLGESVVAVMVGMKQQESWTWAAAGSAGIGMALAFALWWAYFDALGSANPKPVRSPAQLARLRLWTAAHLPLALGIAVSAIGVEHVIAHDGLTPLGRVSSTMLGGGLALVVVCLGVLGTTAPETRRGAAGRRAVLSAHLMLGGCIAGLGWLGAGVRPVLLLLGLFGAAVTVVVVELRQRMKETASSRRRLHFG